MTTARVARPGDLGIDYSGARPSPAATFKAGGRFIIRYSAGVGNTQPATQWKLCGPQEIRDAVRGGLDFIANSEWYESRIAEGARAGAADGAADLKFWRSRGLARGATIYVSWDTAPVRQKWKAADAYLHAYGRALNGYYRVGCYAGTPYLRHALKAKIITHGWRPNAGSWSNDGLPYQPNLCGGRRMAMLARALKATPAAIWQSGSYWWSKSADENLILRPAGTHLEALAKAHGTPSTAKHRQERPKPAPKAPAPLYPVPSGHATALVSHNRRFAVTLDDQGQLVIRKDHGAFKVVVSK